MEQTVLRLTPNELLRVAGRGIVAVFFSPPKKPFHVGQMVFVNDVLKEVRGYERAPAGGGYSLVIVDAKPKRVRLSNLAARYYVRDGWTLELVEKYLKRGKLAVQNFPLLNLDDEYYILEVGGVIDADKMLEDFPALEVQPYCPSEVGKSAKELLKSRNW